MPKAKPATGVEGPVLLFSRRKELATRLLPRLHHRFKVETTTDLEEALKRLASEEPRCLIFESGHPEISDEALLKRLRTSYGRVAVLLTSDDARQIANLSRVAVAAGADGGVFATASEPLWHTLIAEALAARALPEIRRVDPESTGRPWELVGQGSAMRRLLERLRSVDQVNVPLFLSGPPGVGKGLVARYVHSVYSPSEPFLSVNCGNLGDKNTAWSELFGHVKGGYSGADKARVGQFVLAGNGVLFLDEIGELSLELQAQLLDVLTDFLVRPLGGNERLAVTCRVICATNANTSDPTRFRPDLKSRLDGPGWIEVPSLEARRSDIPELFEHLLRLKAHKFGRERLVLAPDVVPALQVASFPGHVRDLEKLAEAMLLLVGPQRRVIGAEDIAAQLGKAAKAYPVIPLAEDLANTMRFAFTNAMVVFDREVGKAADALEVDRSQMRRQMQELGLPLDDDAPLPVFNAPPRGISVRPDRR